MSSGNPWVKLAVPARCARAASHYPRRNAGFTEIREHRKAGVDEQEGKGGNWNHTLSKRITGFQSSGLVAGRKMILSGAEFSCTFPAQRCKSLMLNGAGEGNRTLVSGLGSPRSTIEPHPREGRVYG